MAKLNKIVAVASAAALTMALSAPAYAAMSDTDGTGNYEGTLNQNDTFNADTVITANVSAPDAKVISVTVPSTMAASIATKADGGKTVFDAAKSPEVTASVKNNAKSDLHIKAEVSKVAEKPAVTGGALLSSMVKLTLTGDDAVVLKDGSYTSGNVLASDLAPDASKHIALTASELAPNTEVTDGTYTLTTTIKVSAL